MGGPEDALSSRASASSACRLSGRVPAPRVDAHHAHAAVEQPVRGLGGHARAADHVVGRRRETRRGRCARARCRSGRSVVADAPAARPRRRPRSPPRRRPCALKSSTTPGAKNHSSGSSSIVWAGSPLNRASCSARARRRGSSCGCRSGVNSSTAQPSPSRSRSVRHAEELLDGRARRRRGRVSSISVRRNSGVSGGDCVDLRGEIDEAHGCERLFRRDGGRTVAASARVAPPDRPLAFSAAARLERDLGVSHAVAQVLVRRGLGEPATRARAWLAADEAHDPRAFARHRRRGRADPAPRRAPARASPSTATTTSTACARRRCSCARCARLGADVDWYLPSRGDDGYGLVRARRSSGSRARGTRLLVTVDCAITAVEEVAAARAAGLDVVVTDHHAPRADGALPDAPIVHPALVRLPVPGPVRGRRRLQARAARCCAPPATDPAGADEDLDLVALATVADVVPLRGENRRLVRAGLRALAADRQARPARADARRAGSTPSAPRRARVGFRLAPRINAAGRLYRADAGARAAADRRRRARRGDRRRARPRQRRAPLVEQRILFEAEAQVARAGRAARVRARRRGLAPGRDRDRRLAHRRAPPPPARADRARRRRRGHRLGALDPGVRPARRRCTPRAGTSSATAATAPPRACTIARRRARRVPRRVRGARRGGARARGPRAASSASTRSCAATSSGSRSPRSSSAWRRSAWATRASTLLVPAARAHRPAADGGGQARALHRRGRRRARAARSRSAAAAACRCRAGAPVDATFRLERNEWNGAVEPRLRAARSARPCAPEPIEVARRARRLPSTAALAELATRRWTAPGRAPPRTARRGRVARPPRRRRRRHASPTSSPPASRVLVVVRRRAAPRAPGCARAASAASRSARTPRSSATPELADALRARRRRSTRPRTPAQDARCAPAAADASIWPGARPSYASPRRSMSASTPCAPARGALPGPARPGGAAGEALEALLRGDAPRRVLAGTAAACAAVLAELGLVSLDRDLPALAVPAAERTALERSATFRASAAAIRGRPAMAEASRAPDGRASPPTAPTATGADRRRAAQPAAASAGPVDARRPPEASRWSRRADLTDARARAARRPVRDRRGARRRERAARSTATQVEEAFVFACEHHADQRRKSGEDFIVHPVGVAKICAGMRLDTETLCAALLHDTVEDTSASLEEVARALRRGGRRASSTASRSSPASRSPSRDEAQAENYRKMMVAMASDIRVILIKLADRLHNMRTIGAMPKQKQIEKAKETLEIYAPIAHRLGIHAIKWELEDLAFATLHPRKYQEIKGLVNQQRDERERYVNKAGEYLRERARGARASTPRSPGRAKHFYSIYSKMTKKGREFNEIYDLTAMRVIVDSVKDCYGAVGVIHSLWKPLPGRFKDFIAMPKFNMYQSLHTTVIGPEGRPLEIQIRTREMHDMAEFGVAAHWIYKEPRREGGPTTDGEAKLQLAALDARLAAGAVGPARSSWRRSKVDLFEDEVFVFTPKGEVKSLAAGRDAAGLRLRGPHRRRPPLRRREGQRQDRAAALRAAVRRHRRGADLQARARPVARLARGRQDDARAQQDQAVVQGRVARGHRARRPRAAAGAPAQAGPAGAEDRRLAAAGRRDPRDGLPQGRRLLHRARRRRRSRRRSSSTRSCSASSRARPPTASRPPPTTLLQRAAQRAPAPDELLDRVRHPRSRASTT